MRTYVDGFYIFGHDIDGIQAVKAKIGNAFKIKDLGLAKDRQGMELTQRKAEVELSQRNFIKKILRKYKMKDCKVVTTPTETNLRLEKGDPTGDMSYQEIVGSLMYLSCGTRPDITFIVSYLSQFNSCWNSTHMAALKRVLRYLNGTVDHKLVYKKTGNPLVAYADADWGANADGHSFTGYMLALGGAAFSWQTRKQRCVALSTAEAEYVAICEAAKEVVCAKGLYHELTGQNNTIDLFSDSQSAIKLVYVPTVGRRSKHINIRYHYVRELAEANEICIKYCKTDEMPADIFTKGLTRVKQDYFKKCIGIQWGC